MPLRVVALALVATATFTGLAAELTPAPAQACGDTPGFCPNPPTESDWPAEASGDF
jgi:hypothetical protein